MTVPCLRNGSAATIGVGHAGKSCPGRVCAGVVAFFLSHDLRWLLGALISLAPWPWTLLVIMPVNRRLKDTRADAAGAETRRLVEQWGRLHAGRSAFGVAATLVYLWAAA